MTTALRMAIELLGSQAALARCVGIRPQAVQQWTVKRRVPAARRLSVEQATRGKVSLRPDVFGPEPPCRPIQIPPSTIVKPRALTGWSEPARRMTTGPEIFHGVATALERVADFLCLLNDHARSLPGVDTARRVPV